MIEPSLRAELAQAIREVNAAFNRLPDPKPEVAWRAIDDTLEAAIASGDRERALNAIENWRAWHLQMFAEAA